MGQKAEINGTGYDIKAGKCLVGGTAYAIKKGRTLKDGTGYDVKLAASVTWLLDNSISTDAWGGVERFVYLNSDMDSFVSNGQVFQPYIYLGSTFRGALIYYGGFNSPSGSYGKSTMVYSSGWFDQGYRTVTFPRTLEGTGLYEYFLNMGTII